MRILVVEDDRRAADLLRLFLQKLGHEVVVAYDGWSGFLAATSNQPDAVLSDIEMPDLDGYALAARLRSLGPFKETLLVAVTCHSEPCDVLKAFDSGFDCHLAKPYNLAQVRSLFHNREPALAT